MDFSVDLHGFSYTMFISLPLISITDWIHSPKAPSEDFIYKVNKEDLEKTLVILCTHVTLLHLIEVLRCSNRMIHLH